MTSHKKYKVFDGKQVGSDNGEVWGLAATWDMDSVKEAFVKGAFKKTISEQEGKIPLMVKHFRDGGDVLDAVGLINEMEEKAEGLYVKGQFDDSDVAQEVRGKVRDGIVKNFSVGYMEIQGREVTEGYEITEAALCEITLTMVPVNQSAKIMGSKAEPETPSLEKAVKSTQEYFERVIAIEKAKNINYSN